MRRRRSIQHHQHSLKSIHAVVLGKDGVGKSALTVRFLTRRFIGEYDTSLEATYRHHLVIDSQFVSLDIMDTAGKNSRDKMDTCLTFGELFFIVYSTTDRTSFDEARLLVKYIKQDKTIQPSPHIVIVATKKDMKHLCKVDEYEGRFLAQDCDGLFYQVSVSEGYQEVQDMLEEVLRTCFNREKNKGASSTLSRMKEGIMVKTKNLRRKSVSDPSPAEQIRPTTLGQNNIPPVSIVT